MMTMVAAVSPATALTDRTRPARGDPHAPLRELEGLIIARGPLRRALAAVASRLVATRAWERLGFARLRDYAVERAGHSARSLQDLARVDTALAGLPRVEAALVEGQLTWTKTRLLCRVASADDEALWVEFAREKTARALSRDGWRCTVPGCSSYRELHDHHIRFRSAGGSDTESNRTTLCAWHHLRGVHAGPARLRLRGRAPRRLHFELGLRRGAPALLRYEASDRLSPACKVNFLKKSGEVDDGLPIAIDARDRGALSWQHDASSGVGG